MLDLTPEERQRIYLEEKARLEVRPERDVEKPRVGSGVGTMVLYGIGLLLVLFIIGIVIKQLQQDDWNRLTPKQQHQKTLENCVYLLKSWEFKTYSELSVTERRMQAACSEQLLHPDQDIIKPSH